MNITVQTEFIKNPIIQMYELTLHFIIHADSFIFTHLVCYKLRVFSSIPSIRNSSSSGQITHCQTSFSNFFFGIILEDFFFFLKRKLLNLIQIKFCNYF